MLTAREIERATRGRYSGDAPSSGVAVRRVVIDDRECGPGALFVPIRGERFDGHDFIAGAVRAGAPLVLSERPLEDMGPYVLVENSLDALQALAAEWKRRCDPFTVGVTGSAGKTTTKEMIASVLRQGRRTLATEGNLNNQTGVPRTLLGLEPACEAAVVEMGMNHFGEIDRLARMTKPDVGVVTNVGTAHIEHLGSREGILRAKCEMLPHIKKTGFALVNGDDDLLRGVAADVEKRTFGLGDSNWYRALDVRERGIRGTDALLVSRDGRGVEASIPAPGLYMVYAALAAFACGAAAGLSDRQIADGIAAYSPAGSRMRVIESGGVVLLDDTYNANPAAAVQALRVLEKADGRRVAVLGDMLELGEESGALHRETGREAARRADLVIGVGPLSEQTVLGAREGGAPAAWFPTQEAFLARAGELCRNGDSILVKGSRGMRLENTVRRLSEIFVEGSDGA